MEQAIRRMIARDAGMRTYEYPYAQDGTARALRHCRHLRAAQAAGSPLVFTGSDLRVLGYVLLRVWPSR